MFEVSGLGLVLLRVHGVHMSRNNRFVVATFVHS